jgi:hypothetical protein
MVDCSSVCLGPSALQGCLFLSNLLLSYASPGTQFLAPFLQPLVHQLIQRFRGAVLLVGGPAVV